MPPGGHALEPRRAPTTKGMNANRNAAGCRNCPNDEVLTVTFTADDAQVFFRVCPRCETKWWEREGDQMDLGSALPHVLA
jgi:DNA-directed RNA polymerase subunit M/transcription elongation factor TFIIS